MVSQVTESKINEIAPPPPKECCLKRWWNKKRGHRSQFSQWELDYMIHVRAKSTLQGKTNG